MIFLFAQALILAGGSLFLDGGKHYSAVPFPISEIPARTSNLFFTITTVVVNLLFAFMIVRAADNAVVHQRGLLYLVHLPSGCSTLAGLMLLDLIGAWPFIWSNTK